MNEEKEFISKLNELFTYPDKPVETQEQLPIYMLAMSLTDSIQFLTYLDSIELFVAAVCASNTPDWGIISVIVICLSNAINQNPDKLPDYINQLIEVSYTITHAYFSTFDNHKQLQPNLNPLACSLIYNSKSVGTYDLNTLFTLAEHCYLGFLPGASLAQIVIDKVSSFAQLIRDGNYEEYVKLSIPLGSQDEFSMISFLLLWIFLLSETNHQHAISALTRQICVLNKMLARPEPISSCAQFLIDCINSSQGDLDGLSKKANLVYKNALLDYENYKENLIIENQQLLNRNNSSSTFSSQSAHDTHATQVEILTSKLGSKKWTSKIIMLLEEAAILMWSDRDDCLLNGMAMHLENIDSFKISKSKTNELKIKSEKNSYCISFSSEYSAKSFYTILKERMIKLKH